MPTDIRKKLYEDDFFRGYVEAALWSSNDESTESGGEPMDKNYDIDDIADESLALMYADCVKFKEENAKDITEENCLCYNPELHSVESQAGHDFWMTRVGHGVGFWEDDDWQEEAGERLTESAKRFGECSLYVGDDKRIHYTKG